MSSLLVVLSLAVSSQSECLDKIWPKMFLGRVVMNYSEVEPPPFHSLVPQPAVVVGNPRFVVEILLVNKTNKTVAEDANTITVDYNGSLVKYRKGKTPLDAKVIAYKPKGGEWTP